jgi:acetyl esterase/lipase
MSKINRLSLIVLVLFSFSSCTPKRVTRTKNVIYLKADSTTKKAEQALNVFSPHKNAGSKAVFIFIHGGTWNSGKKETYSFLGNRMARKNVVTVIIDYPKSPSADYDEMAIDATKAVKWVKENIQQYGGDPGKIFISGHSAGGHLAALITVREDYFEKEGMVSPIKGAILIDAAGLDMYSYLKEENFSGDNTFLQTFTTDSVNWKKASPLFHLHKGMPPMLIYVGGKTYPSIRVSNEKLLADLKSLDYDPTFYLLKSKKHKPMIKQFIYSGSHRYKEIIAFMGNAN